REQLLYAANGRSVLLRLWYPGGGSVTLASDAGWFTNQVWRETDVPVVVVPLLASPQGRRGRIVVDEYHQGFGSEAQSVIALSWAWLRQSPVGWAALQLLAIWLVWLAVMAVRFGPARDVVERRRRSPLEHLEALGAGLGPWRTCGRNCARARRACHTRRPAPRRARTGQGHPRGPRLPARARPHPARRRAGHCEDPPGPHARARYDRALRPHPVHARSDAGRYHRNHHADGRRHAGVYVPRGTDFRRSRARRRNQSRPRQ